MNAHARAGGLPFVAKHHHLHVDGGAQSSGMLFNCRYTLARLLSQLLNTAPTARSSCSRGSSGKASPRVLLKQLLVADSESLRSSALRSVSSLARPPPSYP